MKMTFFGPRAKHANDKVIRTIVQNELDDHDPDYVYIGLTVPTGFIVAEECLKRRIPYKVVLAFKHEYTVYSSKNIHKYMYLLRKAHSSVSVDRHIDYVSLFKHPDVYEKSKYFQRDHAIHSSLNARDLVILINKEGHNTTMTDWIRWGAMTAEDIKLYTYTTGVHTEVKIRLKYQIIDDLPF